MSYPCPAQSLGCKKRFSLPGGLTKHRKTCPFLLQKASRADEEERTWKRAKLDDNSEPNQAQAPGPSRTPTDVPSTSSPSLATIHEHTDQMPSIDVEPQPERSPSPTVHFAADITMGDPAPAAPVVDVGGPRRSGRSRRPPKKIRDQLPEGPGELEPSATMPEDATTSTSSSADRPFPSRLRRAAGHVTTVFRTAANRFGLSRLYRGRPVRVPDMKVDINDCYVPIADNDPHPRAPRTVPEIIHPYPNLSSYYWAYHHQFGGDSKSMEMQERLRKLLLKKDSFVVEDIDHINFTKLRDLLVARHNTPWSEAHEGWTEDDIIIGIPLAQRSTISSRREAASDRQRFVRKETIPDAPSQRPIQGHPYRIPGFWHRSIVNVIRKVFSSDPAFNDFHLEPFELLHQEPGSSGGPERVHGTSVTPLLPTS